jgi:hypothetical protein
MVVFANETPYHLATNFLRASAGESAEGECWRYDRLSQRLRKTEGRMTSQDAMDLLAAVSQKGTQWSIVYGMSTGDVSVAMERQYGAPHIFHLGSGRRGPHGPRPPTPPGIRVRTWRFLLRL